MARHIGTLSPESNRKELAAMPAPSPATQQYLPGLLAASHTKGYSPALPSAPEVETPRGFELGSL